MILKQLSLLSSSRYGSLPVTKMMQRVVASEANAKVTTRSLNIASRPSDLVGGTPLIDLGHILKAHGIDGECQINSIGLANGVREGHFCNPCNHTHIFQ